MVFLKIRFSDDFAVTNFLALGRTLVYSRISISCFFLSPLVLSWKLQHKRHETVVLRGVSVYLPDFWCEIKLLGDEGSGGSQTRHLIATISTLTPHGIITVAFTASDLPRSRFNCSPYKAHFTNSCYCHQSQCVAEPFAMILRFIFCRR